MDINVKCPGCNKENDFYRLNCINCGYLLRDKVPNIDLWASFWGIFTSPSEVIKKVIWAEHKNFMLFLVLLLCIKVFFYTKIIPSAFNPGVMHPNLELLLWSIPVTIFTILIFSLLISIISKRLFVKTRWKDNLALLSYSQIPMIISLIVIVPSAYALFGKYLFTFRPPIHEIKPSTAYFLYVLELICFIWSVLLSFIAIKIQTGKILISLILALLYVIIYSFSLSIFYL